MIGKAQNITELRSRKGTHLATIILLGLNNNEDGKGGIFYWNQNSEQIDDSNSILKVTSVNTGRWIRATSGIVGNTTDINEITNVLINNEDFITNAITKIFNTTNNSTTNIINKEILGSVIQELNVEIQDINGKTLFFAFNPKTVPQIEEDIIDDIITPPEPIVNCSLPDTVLITGNLKPSINTNETYEFDVTNAPTELDYIITWVVQGGEIIGASSEPTVNVDWSDGTDLASISVGLSCSTEDIIYDFWFFNLKSEEDVDEISIINSPIITSINANSQCP
jgi:hypothetical protein